MASSRGATQQERDLIAEAFTGLKRCMRNYCIPCWSRALLLVCFSLSSVSGWHGWQPGHGEDHLERRRVGGPVRRYGCVCDAVDEGVEIEVCLRAWLLGGGEWWAVMLLVVMVECACGGGVVVVGGGGGAEYAVDFARIQQ